MGFLLVLKPGPGVRAQENVEACTGFILLAPDPGPDLAYTFPVHYGKFADVEVGAVTDDSRAVGRGGMFVAVRGRAADGHSFVRDAIGRGGRVTPRAPPPIATGAGSPGTRPAGTGRWPAR